MSEADMLIAIFHAGRVQRWHTNPWLSRSGDSLDGHHGRVARLLLALHPSPSVTLLRAALTHDDGESVTGDLPGPFKAKWQDTAFGLLEAQAAARLWGGEFPVTPLEAQWLLFADRLDAYMWVQHHAPECMARDEWREAAEWLETQAGELGVGGCLA